MHQSPVVVRCILQVQRGRIIHVALNLSHVLDDFVEEEHSGSDPTGYASITSLDGENPVVLAVE